MYRLSTFLSTERSDQFLLRHAAEAPDSPLAGGVDQRGLRPGLVDLTGRVDDGPEVRVPRDAEHPGAGCGAVVHVGFLSQTRLALTFF